MTRGVRALLLCLLRGLYEGVASVARYLARNQPERPGRSPGEDNTVESDVTTVRLGHSRSLLWMVEGS